jgi:hypothetical protein
MSILAAGQSTTNKGHREQSLDRSVRTLRMTGFDFAWTVKSKGNPQRAMQQGQ